MRVIKISEDFSPEPVGRYYSDGPDSGERFLDELLLPSLKSEDVVKVDLNDIEGCGSSFLEESFGGLVRYGYFTASQLRQQLNIQVDDVAMYEEIMSYINEAKYDSEERQ